MGKIMNALFVVAAVTAVGSMTVALKVQKKLKDVLEDKNCIHVDDDIRRIALSNLNTYAETDSKVDSIIKHVSSGIQEVKIHSGENNIVYKFHGHIDDRTNNIKSQGLDIIIGEVKPKDIGKKEVKEEAINKIIDNVINNEEE